MRSNNDCLSRIRTRAEKRRLGDYAPGFWKKGLCFVQGDQSIANQAGAAFRSDLNNELQALVTSSQGNSAPSTTYRNQWWHDTTNSVVKRRNAANSAWIVRDTLDESFVLSRSSNTILGISDYGKTLRCTGSFTQTVTAAATLGDGWWCELRNDNVAGGGVVTIDPNSSETIDGATTQIVEPGESCIINCNGSAFYTVGRARSYAPLSRGHLSGFTLSNNATTTKMDVAAGKGRDSTDVVDIVLTAAITAGLIQTSGSWAAGSTQNKLDTGARANSTWYHVFAIRKDSDGSGDFLISLSATAPTMPSGYTYFRRLGSVKTDGSGNITAFVHDGDYFRWAASVLDINVSNPGTSAVSRTLSVPTGVNVFALFNAQVASENGVADGATYLSDLAANDEAASATAAPLNSLGETGTYVSQLYGSFMIRTNTSAQIRSRAIASSTNTGLKIATLGWIDRRGRDS